MANKKSPQGDFFGNATFKGVDFMNGILMPVWCFVILLLLSFVGVIAIAAILMTVATEIAKEQEEKGKGR